MGIAKIEAIGLDGARVLLVEDDCLVGDLLSAMLESAGCIVSGPMATVLTALEVIDQGYDAAILDINLRGERSDSVADALWARDVPIMFVTGLGSEGLTKAFADRPCLNKPFKRVELLHVLMSILDHERA